MSSKTVFVIETYPRHYFADGYNWATDFIHDATPYTISKARRLCAEMRAEKEKRGLPSRRFPRVVKVVTEAIPID